MKQRYLKSLHAERIPGRESARKACLRTLNGLDRHILEDIGVPLPVEEEALRARDATGKVTKIAASLGIETDYRLLSLRTYSKPERWSEILRTPGAN